MRSTDVLAVCRECGLNGFELKLDRVAVVESIDH